MIEKTIIKDRVKQKRIQEYIADVIGQSKYSYAEIKKTPLGEQIIIHTTRPGLVVGRSGSNIVSLTSRLKKKFKLENPQVEVAEILNPNTNPRSVAEKIVSHFDRFGTKGFKMIGYRELENIMHAGALGAEIVISGRGVPSSRSKTWRFQAGYLKKSGNISESYVKRAITAANLRSGSVGIRVSILPADVKLPDKITLKRPEKPVEAVVVKEEKTAIPEEKAADEPAMEAPKAKKKPSKPAEGTTDMAEKKPKKKTEKKTGAQEA